MYFEDSHRVDVGEALACMKFRGWTKRTKQVKLADYYEVLDVSQSASQLDIRNSFLQLIRRAHPDKNTTKDDNAVLLNKAYEVLSDPVRRSAYDAALKSRKSSSNVTLKTRCPDPKSCTENRETNASLNRTVDLSAFRFDVDKDTYSLVCRCGSNYVATGDELEAGDGELLVQCDGCSQRVRVEFEVAAEGIDA